MEKNNIKILEENKELLQVARKVLKEHKKAFEVLANE